MSPSLTDLVYLPMDRISDLVHEVVAVLALGEPLGVLGSQPPRWKLRMITVRVRM
jgi:hypothetical protein